jgi:hypothetical protein
MDPTATEVTALEEPAFFPSVSRVDECWWVTGDSSTVYLWDTMEDQDRQD